MTTTSDCRNLKAYIMDELGPEARNRFETHLATCTPCARALKADTALRNALAAMPQVAAPHRFSRQVMEIVATRRKNRAAWLVYAASLAVLAILTTILATGSLASLAREGTIVIQAVLDTGAALYTVVRNVSATLYHDLNFGRSTPVVLTGTVLGIALVFFRSLHRVSRFRRD